MLYEVITYNELNTQDTVSMTSGKIAHEIRVTVPGRLIHLSPNSSQQANFLLFRQLLPCTRAEPLNRDVHNPDTV